MIFERVALDSVNRAIEVREYASGKSPNVARVLKSLGGDPLEIGFAGGTRGKFLVDDLTNAGISCDFMQIESQTRLCTTVIDRSSGFATELVEEHAAVPDDAWEEMDRKLRERLTASRTWIFSGSLPTRAPPDFYARWAPLARERGATYILDARGEAMRQALRLGGFIAKLNRDELADTLRQPIDSESALHESLRRIVPAGGAAIVTLGARGALACQGDQIWRITPPAIEAVSPIGSGDAFSAGLAHALERGESFADALSLAAACGSANALTSRAGFLDPQDVRRLRAEVVVAKA